MNILLTLHYYFSAASVTIQGCLLLKKYKCTTADDKVLEEYRQMSKNFS